MKHFSAVSGLALLFLLIFQSCKKEEIPAITTSPVTNVTATTASCGGNITNEGSSPVIARGVCWGTNATPTIEDEKTTESSGAGTFTSNMTDLDAATTYYVRAYATNSAGTAYGAGQSFTTLGEKPAASVSDATNITATSATLNGAVTANLLTTTVTFEYGLTTSYGKSSTAVQSPATGENPTNVSVGITGLNVGTIYHFRIKAVNSLGTTYSEDHVLETLLMDQDGNEYHAITIGTQVWMQENLKTSKLNDGTAISYVPIPSEWINKAMPAYSWYGNNEDNKGSYGALYNFYTVNTGKLCPAGWHVASREEWVTLINFLGGVEAAGGKLKEAGTLHWNAPNADASNESQFTALPGGYRSYTDAAFFSQKDNCSMWSSSLNTSSTAYIIAITLYNTTDVQIVSGNLKYGVSVRCLKDN